MTDINFTSFESCSTVRTFIMFKGVSLFCVMGADGVVVVTEDSTCAADPDTLHTAVHTPGAVQGGGVGAAHGLGPAPELDVARVLGEHVPVHVAPGVLPQPVVPINRVSPVAHQQHSVVDDDVLVIVTAVKHASKVQTPVRGCY